MSANALASSVAFYHQEFIKLEQSSQQNPPALCVLNEELRFVLLNARMAQVCGLTVEECRGLTIRESNAVMAQSLDPIILHVVKEGTPLADLEIELMRQDGDELTVSSYWRISCVPLKSGAGMVRGVGIALRDITEQKLRETMQDERLKFETLLTTFSAEFVNVPASEVGRKIEHGLQKINEFLGFGRSSVWLFSPEDGRLYLTYSHALSGIKPPPAVIDDIIPVWVAMARKGEMFKISDVENLPDNQWREKKYCRDMGGIKSMLFIPLVVAGNVLGIISFASYGTERAWPDVFIQRLRLLGEILANALERQRAEQKIQEAFAEIEAVKRDLEAENLHLRDQVYLDHKNEEIIGQSEAVRLVMQQARQVAGTGSTVLILGETGTGKELVAKAIHSLSSRRERAMIRINCAALPPTLIEAELFGSEKGAFTGSTARQIGRFEAADGSSIFLDEIGELPLELQAKLLRVLQEGQFERLGSSRPVDVDVRVIAATNRDLGQQVKEGKFREDLYYRLNVFPLSLPPLRERAGDIPLLVWAMVKEFGAAFGKSVTSIPRKNMEALERYPWPGNIRELRNMVERAMILCNGPTLTIDVPDSTSASVAALLPLNEVERLHILAVLEKTGWRVRGRNGTAEILGMKPTTLESRMLKLGIRRRPVA